MADVKWIKITTDVFDDEKILLIESMPDADAIIVIWFKLLCLAGKQNNSGVFLMNNRIAYTDEMLATIFRRPLNTVRLALQVFEQYGMVELIDGVITIPNWDKHQNLDALEKKREADRERQRVRRAVQKENVTRLSRDVSADCSALDKNKNKKENINNKSVIFPDYPAVEEAFATFEESRKAMKAKLTDRARELAVRRLEELAKGPQGQFDEKVAIAMINQAVLNGWKSFYPLKKDNAQKTSFATFTQSNTDTQLDEMEQLLLNEVNN